MNLEKDLWITESEILHRDIFGIKIYGGETRTYRCRKKQSSFFVEVEVRFLTCAETIDIIILFD